jgi:hypothetical protein
MKMIRPLNILLLLVTLVPIFSGLGGCKNYATEGDYTDGKVTQSGQIVGLWKRSDAQNSQSIAFKDNGAFVEDDILSGIHVIAEGTYTVSEGVIILTVTGSGLTAKMFDAKIEVDKLYVSQVLKSGETLKTFWTKS